MITSWCACVVFVLWYTTDDGVRVCRCGHPSVEHLDGERSCLGEVEVPRV